MIKYRLLGDMKMGSVSIGGESIKLTPENYKGKLTGTVQVPEARRSFIESDELFLRGNLIEILPDERGKELTAMATEQAFENSPFTRSEYQTLFDLPKEAKDLIKENAFMVRDRFLQTDGTTEKQTDDVPKSNYGVPLVEASVEGKYGQHIEDPDKGKFGVPVIIPPGETRSLPITNVPANMTSDQMLDAVGQGKAATKELTDAQIAEFQAQLKTPRTAVKSSEIITDVKQTTKPGKAILKKK